MRAIAKSLSLTLLLSICAIYGKPVSAAVLNDAHALRGLHAAKAVFLINVKKPQVLANVVRVANMAYTSMARQGVKPHFVMVIIGPDVAFLTKNMVGLSYGQREAAAHLQNEVKEMTHEGIRFEACGVSLADEVDINPHDLIPQVHAVGNGFISAIGYQAKGYALVPFY